MRGSRVPGLALACCWLPAALAQENESQSPAPDLDFFEYLGTWAEDDDEWLAIEEWEKDSGAEPPEAGADGDPKGSEQQKEGDDESP